MSHHTHNQDPTVKERAAISVFWRIFRRFAGRYWFRLTLGIVAGVLMSGSLSVILRVMDFGLNVFEDFSTGGGKNEAVVKTAEGGKTKAAPNAPANTTDAKELQKEKKLQGNIAKYARIAEDIAKRLGFELHIDVEGKMSLELLLSIFSVVFVAFVFRAGGEFITKYCLHWTGARIVTDIRIALFDRLQKQSAAFYDQHDVGRLIARCTNDTAMIEHSIGSTVADLIIAPMMILASVQFIISKAVQMNLVTQSLWLLVAIPACILPVYALSRYLRKYQRRILSGIAVLVSRMQENFSGNRLVKAFNTEAYESGRFTVVSNHYFKSVKKAMIASLMMTPIMQIVVLLLGALFMYVCYKYGITLASLATLGFAAQESYRPIKDLAKVNTDLQKSAAAGERILALLEADTELKALPPVVAPTSFNDEIVFKDVSFQYTPTAPEVLSDINFTIKKGQLVALVGSTGSGKSTIASLLVRFYDPTNGSITMDGTDLRHIDNASFRRIVSIVTQDTFLFNESLAANIRYGTEDATMEQISLAARNANVEDFILSLPDTYDHPAGERGNHLSGGQKQRISIARALLRNPPILILDEATSALDTKTEKIVQEAFDKLMKDRTVLAIAHRLSTIINADLILVCDHGRIIERGTHQQLYELNGAYRKLYDLQFNAQQES